MSKPAMTSAGRTAFPWRTMAVAATAAAAIVWAVTDTKDTPAPPTTPSASAGAQPSAIYHYRLASNAPLHQPGPQSAADGYVAINSCVYSVTGPDRRAPSRAGDFYEVKVADFNGLDFYQGFIDKKYLIDAGPRDVTDWQCTGKFIEAAQPSPAHRDPAPAARKFPSGAQPAPGR